MIEILKKNTHSGLTNEKKGNVSKYKLLFKKVFKYQLLNTVKKHKTKIYFNIINQKVQFEEKVKTVLIFPQILVIQKFVSERMVWDRKFKLATKE